MSTLCLTASPSHSSNITLISLTRQRLKTCSVYIFGKSLSFYPFYLNNSEDNSFLFFISPFFVPCGHFLTFFPRDSGIAISSFKAYNIYNYGIFFWNNYKNWFNQIYAILASSSSSFFSSSFPSSSSYAPPPFFLPILLLLLLLPNHHHHHLHHNHHFHHHHLLLFLLLLLLFFFFFFFFPIYLQSSS
ncbi:unnamed protein product [Acanthosepion pharaonis]|uniref:Uncharacterized protein n=1 Tax=Acanthosepion pharaonis TaxID=158019 RepID=A0A812DZ58_ACAPH|nr:unnamed protein product [Sepia pharaonis]